MKRSDMVRKVHERLDGTFWNRETYVSDILEIFEDFGMVGPKYNVNETLTGRQKEIAIKLAPSGYMVHGWEPEDEKHSDNGNT